MWCSYLFIYLIFFCTFYWYFRESFYLVATLIFFLFLLKYQTKTDDYNPLRDPEFKIIYLSTHWKKHNYKKRVKNHSFIWITKCEFSLLSRSLYQQLFFQILCFSLINYTRKLSTSRNRKWGQINNTCRGDFCCLRKLVFIADGYKQTVAN